MRSRGQRLLRLALRFALQSGAVEDRQRVAVVRTSPSARKRIWFRKTTSRTVPSQAGQPARHTSEGDVLDGGHQVPQPPFACGICEVASSRTPKLPLTPPSPQPDPQPSFEEDPPADSR